MLQYIIQYAKKSQKNIIFTTLFLMLHGCTHNTAPVEYHIRSKKVKIDFENNKSHIIPSSKRENNFNKKNSDFDDDIDSKNLNSQKITQEIHQNSNEYQKKSQYSQKNISKSQLNLDNNTKTIDLDELKEIKNDLDTNDDSIIENNDNDNINYEIPKNKNNKFNNTNKITSNDDYLEQNNQQIQNNEIQKKSYSASENTNLNENDMNTSSKNKHLNENIDLELDNEETNNTNSYIKNKYSFKFLNPVEGILKNKFDESVNNKKLLGINILAKGSAVKAAEQGKVIYVGFSKEFGKLIIIQHQNHKVAYAHCGSILVKLNDQVSKGEKIAEIKPGNIFYLAVQADNNAVKNPQEYFDY